MSSRGTDMCADSVAPGPGHNADYVRHNHLTRDIKPKGECPACDEIHAKGQLAESVALCCQRLMDTQIVCTVPLHQECPKCERQWLWDQGTWTALTDGTGMGDDHT